VIYPPANGGPGRVVARLDTAAGEVYFDQPHALADGNTVLFAIQPNGGVARSRLAILSLKTGTVVRTQFPLLDPLGIIDDKLVYVTATGALTAIPLDVHTGRTSGNPVTLGPNVLTTVAGASEAALAPGGTLVYQTSNAAAILGWADASGAFQPLLSEPQGYSYPRLSPDGRRIAMTIVSGGRSDVWLYDIASSTPTRLTNSGTLNDRPEWSPDGTHVLYRGDRGNRSAVWWQPADLSGPPVPLLSSDQHSFYEGVIAPGGNALVYQVDDGGANQADVRYRPVSGDTTSHPIAASEFVEAQPRFSPDGHWIATVTGRTPVFADEYMFAQAPHANYDVSPDGKKFLMVKSAERPELFVVYGWADELRAQLKGAGGN
jgi:hypothetical protein